ncbi:MAG: hypothetical protein Q9180_005275 [Flavoplaca navasiana]
MTDSDLRSPEALNIEYLEESFKYIIVGGGTSGLVVASRLTEDPNTTVLILEAGSAKVYDSRIKTPGLAVALWDNPEFDWQFKTTPQNALNGRTIAHPRGKMIGGSSAINVGLVAYPSQFGLDSWEKLGNKGWNFTNLRSYNQKFHTYAPASKVVEDILALDYIDQSAQGTTGPIQVSFGDFQGPLQKQWPETFETLGMKCSRDPLTGLKTRSHAGSSYYEADVRKRPNVRLLSEAMVEKVILTRQEDGKLLAKGVQFTSKAGKKHIANASQEVILNAGAFPSPQLPELSGTGSRQLLERLGIEVMIDNPFVGKNLQDHPMASISLEIADNMSTADILRDPRVFNAAIEEYQNSKTSLLTSGTYWSASLPVLDFLQDDGPAKLSALLDQHPNNDASPTFPAQKHQYELLRGILQSKDDASIHCYMAPFQMNVEAGSAASKCFSPVTEGNYVTMLAALNHPFSRGSVHINSADVNDKPIIDPRYLSDPLDNEILARHLRFMETLIRTEPLASAFKKDGRRVPADLYVETLEEARKLGPWTVTSNFHPSGTCAMMPKDLGGVLDEQLIVYGTTNLRVMDASIFPLEPRGNLQSSVYAVAERASDIIKGVVG